MKLLLRSIICWFLLFPTWLIAATDVSQFYDVVPDINTCSEGKLKQVEKTAVLSAVNYVRSLHHLDLVEYNSTDDVLTAKSALISAANCELTHEPTAAMRCYSEQGYKGSSTSNLHYSAFSGNYSRPTSESSVNSFLIDEEVESLGHRRWILDPFLKTISFGRVDSNVAVNGYFCTGMTLKVINDDSRDCTNVDNDFVAYPYGNYPLDYVSPEWYWSFSALADKCDKWANNKVDYSKATITITNATGTSMVVSGIKYNTQSYGLSNILQWKVKNAKAGETYQVAIQKVIVAGQSKNFSYDVKISLDGTNPTPTPTPTATLEWQTSKADAFALAKSEGKLVLLVAGRDDCGNTQYMRNKVAKTTSPPIQDLLQQHFVLWYANIDTDTDHEVYQTGLGSSWYLPVIVAINPNDSEHYLDRTTGVQDPADFYARLQKLTANSPTPVPTPNPTPTDGSLVTDNLWIKAVINTEEKGAINAVWKPGGDAKTSRGDRVVWGYFYASRSEVTWGDENNPDAFVKIWYDVSGRVDVNFFHVSVPDIEVYSSLEEVSTPATNTISMSRRYAHHAYQPKMGTVTTESPYTVEIQGTTPVIGNPKHNVVSIQSLQMGAAIQSVEKGSIDGVWRFGGQGTTSRGDQVVWGFFYANPKDVTWGQAENPDLYVKVWYDAVAKRIDVSFFHVSVPDIKAYSGFTNTSYDKSSTTTVGERYTRHVYYNR